MSKSSKRLNPSSLPLKPGDEIYVPTQWSIDHGDDDMDGGIATVQKIDCDDYGNAFVDVGLFHSLNIDYIMENQEAWKKEYGDRIAHNCPEGQWCADPRRKSPKKSVSFETIVREAGTLI